MTRLDDFVGCKFMNITVNSSCPDPRQKEKINLNFYFHTSL